MRFTVESWSPDYGSPVEAGAVEPDVESGAQVDVTVELPADAWRPLCGEGAPAPAVAFVDGVRRIDARVWLADAAEGSAPGICASYAAGVVRCAARATLESALVERGLFVAGPATAIRTPSAIWLAKPVRIAEDASSAGPADLGNAVQTALRELEIRVAESVGEAELVVLDGPLRGRQHLRAAVGYMKSHWVAYLSGAHSAVVAQLTPGERTPLFRITADWSRYSWYLRLPGGEGHPWAGVVRCEVTDLLAVEEARRFADLTAATLPRFASLPHKDPRAPQNLYPIAGLESELRRRLGDRELLFRALRRAAREA